MCGRYSMYESMDFYLKQLSLDLVVIDGYDDARINRYNVAPASHAEVIRSVPGGLSVDQVKWGWSPPWARDKRPAPINARGETVITGAFFKALWAAGRALAPANGWFEWVSDVHDPKCKQPYYVQPVDGGPLFFAALAQVDGGTGDGFVILTAAADQGLVDLHHRKPLVLSPELAREWIDPGTSRQRIAQIVQGGGRGAADFRWHPVGKQVGNVRSEGEALIAQVRPRAEGAVLA